MSSKFEEEKNSYYVIDDDEIDGALFNRDILDHILLYEKSVELIGVIGSSELKSNLMKFNLINKSDDVVQCIIWDIDIINKFKKLIMPGNVVLISGGFARPKHPTLSSGNFKYDVTIMSNTIIKILKESVTLSSVPITKEIPLVSIENVMQHCNEIIQVEGYMKNVIKETSLPNSKVNQGCLSDCQNYKLEVRMPIMCDMSEFKVGSHVRIKGTMKYSQCPYLWVLQKEDVILESKTVRRVFEVLKGTKIPKRSHSEDVQFVTKLLKTE